MSARQGGGPVFKRFQDRLRTLEDRIRKVENRQRASIGCWRFEAQGCELYAVHGCTGERKLLSGDATVPATTDEGDS